MSDQILNNTVMVLKADSLQGPRPTKGKLNKIVITHIRHIEQEIKNADGNNKTYIDYKIESDFDDIPGMPNSEVQVFVYSKIIEDLTTCGYDVYFRNVRDDYTFFIKWGSAMASLELENRKKILKIASFKYQNKKKQIHIKKANKLKGKDPNDTIRGLSNQMKNLNTSNKGSMLKTRPLNYGSQGAENSHLDYKDLQSVLDGSDSDDEDEDLDDADWSSILNAN